MSFFSQLFGRKTKQSQRTEQALKEIYLQFARLISGNDDAVLAQVRDLFEHTAVFLATHQERYDERGINTEQISKETLYWISFADILIAHNYAADFNWKCELEDFEYFLKDLQMFKSYPSIELPELDENGSIDLCIEQINAYWKNQPIALMQQDINSDSYVVFPINKEHIAFLNLDNKDTPPPKLNSGECHSYVPALALVGGSNSVKNLKMVDAKAYIHLIGQA